MLVLTRRPGEAFQIAGNITITISEVSGKKVRVAIDAPRDVPVDRLDPPRAVVAEDDDGSRPHPTLGAAA